MFQELPEYAETAPSGYWEAPIPAHWDVIPGLAVLTENKRKNSDLAYDQVLSLSYGRIVVKPLEKQRGLVPGSYEGYQVVGPGDTVIRPTDLQNDQTSVRVGMVRDRGIITSAYIGLRPRGHWSADYAYAYLSVVDSSKRIYGMGGGLRQQLGWEDLKRVPCLVPPANEQAAIVKYLAHANARIDKAVAAKRRLIALFHEQQEAVVRHLLMSSPGGDSANWRYVPAGRLCKIATGVEDSGNAVPDGAYPFYVRGREILRANNFHMDAEAVMTPGDGQGGVGKVFHYFNGKFQAHQRLYIFTDFSGIDGRFFYWYLSSFFRRYALSQSNTVTMESLRRRVLAGFPVAVPPHNEQREIVRRIEAEGAGAQSATSMAEREIELLEEFRTRLVADVVTGRVDVRDIAASLPEIDLTRAVADTTGDVDRREVAVAMETSGV